MLNKNNSYRVKIFFLCMIFIFLDYTLIKRKNYIKTKFKDIKILRKYSDKNNINNNETDEYYIKNYKGGDLEPEWQWVKNISIVYTWVDGSDLDFLEIKSKYDHGYKINNNRYRSADELKYSLRSLEKYMPWHTGIIYLVTSQQIPKWLDIKNSRLKIIDHKDIIPKNIYPTFDSNTIELFLDRISGITERFIYFNDDVFLNNFVHPSFFFTNKTFFPKVYKNRSLLKLKKKEVEKYISENSNMFKVTNYFTRELIRTYFDSSFEYYTLCHTPFAFYRDLFEPFRRLFKDEFKKSCAYRFRNHYKIQTIYLLHTFTQYATQHKDFPLKLNGEGKAKNFEGYILPLNRTIYNYSIKIIEGDISNKYIIYGKVIDNSNKNLIKFNNIRNNKNILIYNINDEYTKSNILYELLEFLIEQYPSPSLFEKKEYYKLEISISENINLANKFTQKIEKSFSKKYLDKNENKIKNFNELVYDYKIRTLKKYLNEKNKQNGISKVISDKEKNEIELLLNYNGEKLEKEWNWAKNISIVYIIEQKKNNKIILDYNNIEVLKYSIRSIEKYLPWFEGNIFIIVQRNIKNNFTWLNMNNDRIKIIHQNKIIPKRARGTKNRHIIEMYLDKIPNISEKFIFLNQNHYFKHYTHPSFFFSKEYYPKYNLMEPIPFIENDNITKNSIINTYNVIRDYFGNNYITVLRYIKNEPIVLYRDLFNPVRELYKPYVNDLLNIKKYKVSNILPLYLLITYNIYGTEQPYYPNYVIGFGKIKNSKLPNLNKKRTISYYGFDITSPIVSKTTILKIDKFSNNIENNYKINLELKYSKKLFFTFLINPKEELSIESIKSIKNIMNDLYNKKSSFEI